jgi:hypothetical protein
MASCRRENVPQAEEDRGAQARGEGDKSEGNKGEDRQGQSGDDAQEGARLDSRE